MERSFMTTGEILPFLPMLEEKAGVEGEFIGASLRV
jgi:hypothetical protein